MNNLKKTRIQQNYTLKDVAEMAHISESYLCRLEKGSKKNPSQKVMYNLSIVLGKSVSELFNIWGGI